MLPQKKKYAFFGCGRTRPSKHMLNSLHRHKQRAGIRAWNSVSLPVIEATNADKECDPKLMKSQRRMYVDGALALHHLVPLQRRRPNIV